MLSIFNNDIEITMEDNTQLRGNRKIYKSPNLVSDIPTSGCITLYKNYKEHQEHQCSIDYKIENYKIEDNTDKWFQLNQNTDKYVIQLRGYFQEEKEEKEKKSISKKKFILTKVAIQELLIDKNLLLNI
jgi:hypothetical protein